MRMWGISHIVEVSALHREDKVNDQTVQQGCCTGGNGTDGAHSHTYFSTGLTPARWTSWQSTAPRRSCRKAAGQPPGRALRGGWPSAAAVCAAGSGWCAWGTA